MLAAVALIIEKTQKPHIECVCMDMSNAYGKWVRENLPGVPVIYDHFHVIKAMNDRINSIRHKAMARISATCGGASASLTSRRWRRR